MKEKNSIVLIKTIAKEVNAEKGISEIIAEKPYREKNVALKIIGDGLNAKFYFGSNKNDLQQIGDTQDLSNFGDEIAWGFNGTYVGMYATSLGERSKKKALFNWFEYKNSK